MSKPNNLADFLNMQKTAFYERNRDARFLIKAFGRCLAELSKHTDADLAWVHEELMNEMGDKFRTKAEALDIGGLVALLVCFGSSVEQAKKAVEQLYGISEKKTRDAYNMVLEDFGIRDKSQIASNIEFRSTFVYEASSVTQKLGKPFPTEYPAAFEAYQKALGVEKDFARHGSKVFENSNQ